ncbi:hypothetical protein [Microbacterium sp. ZW T5_56]|uniref:hypothetical protein n=1 Tax=Microbacterium sp. ZW T5_56 TaxID=3378081 RepID=UPI0038518995
MSAVEVLGAISVVLAMVGALAVVAALAWLIVGLTTSWKSRPARVVRMIFFILGITCAVLGAILAWVHP